MRKKKMSQRTRNRTVKEAAKVGRVKRKMKK